MTTKTGAGLRFLWTCRLSYPTNIFPRPVTWTSCRQWSAGIMSLYLQAAPLGASHWDVPVAWYAGLVHRMNPAAEAPHRKPWHWTVRPVLLRSTTRTQLCHWPPHHLLLQSPASGYKGLWPPGYQTVASLPAVFMSAFQQGMKATQPWSHRNV